MMQKYKTKILDTSLHSIDTVLYNIFSWASCLPLAGRCSGCVVWMWPALGSSSAIRVLCRTLPRILLTTTWSAVTVTGNRHFTPVSKNLSGLSCSELLGRGGGELTSSVTTGRTFVAQAAHREYSTFQYDKQDFWGL